MPALWFESAATETAAIWKRNEAPAGATYTLFASGLACYHYPEKPRDDEITEFGQLASTVYVWVFDEVQAVPRQVCVVSGGVGYVSMSVTRTPSIGPGEGGNVQVR